MSNEKATDEKVFRVDIHATGRFAFEAVRRARRLLDLIGDSNYAELTYTAGAPDAMAVGQVKKTTQSEIIAELDKTIGGAS